MNESSNEVRKSVRKIMNGEKMPSEDALNNSEMALGANYGCAMNSY